MASVSLCAICGRPQSSRMVIPHSASEGNTDFFAVLLVFSPTDHADFQMQIHTACEKSVSICRTSGAICGLTNHPAWHLCCSVGSVGVPNHPAWQFFTQHSKDPIPHYKTTRLFAEAYTPNLRKSPLFRFPQSLSCFLLQDNQRYFLLPHDIAPRLQVFPICVIRLEYVG